MRYRLVIILAAFAAVGAMMTYLLYRHDKAQQNASVVAALAPPGATTATPSRAATVTPTASPLPTVDYSAVYPAQTQAAAIDAMAVAQAKIARAAATLAQV